MLIRLNDPDGNILVVNTEHVAAIVPIFDKPRPENNHGIPTIGQKQTRILGMCIIQMGQGFQIPVKGDPDAIYDRIKTYQKSLREGVIE
jgi:hypothetical protein